MSCSFTLLYGSTIDLHTYIHRTAFLFPEYFVLFSSPQRTHRWHGRLILLLRELNHSNGTVSSRPNFIIRHVTSKTLDHDYVSIITSSIHDYLTSLSLQLIYDVTRSFALASLGTSTYHPPLCFFCITSIT